MGRAGKFAVHLILAFGAAYIACYLAAGAAMLARPALTTATLFAACAGAVELVMRLERAPWRFVAMGDVLRLARSGLIAIGLFIALAALLKLPIQGGGRTMLLTLLLYPGALGGVRIARRALHEGAFLETLTGLGAHAPTRAPLLIVGEAQEADAYLRAPHPANGAAYTPVGVVSPTAKEVGEEFRGVCVLGTVRQFDEIFERLREGGLAPAAVLFLSHPGALEEMNAERLGRLKSEGVRLLRQPGVVELAKGPSVAGLREVSLEELLARPPVQLDLEAACALVAGKRVLVTGAGGSIGSEICRQVAACGAGRLVLLDASESALFEIDCEIAQAWPDLPRRVVLCDIRDQERLAAWMAEEAPQIVFHAAALKHVPMVEGHPCEGVLTNVFGTRNVIEAARGAGAEHLLLISTDKAVDPTSVMGATKRLAETLVRTAAGPAQRSIVRFGNVLGSAGSVATVFQHQIERGGPITVTDAAMERYFMTIPEAVRLVLRAAALSAGREEPTGVMTLEMGEPVKIIDLARRMVELNGLVPDKDVAIHIVGLRPGEKLSEDLVDANEEARALAPGVIEAVSAPVEAPSAAQWKALENAARRGDAEAARDTVFALVRQVRLGRPTQTKQAVRA